MSLLPLETKLHAVGNNGNSVTFALPGHTTVAPRLVQFKRVIPEYSRGTWSTPSYTTKVIFGVVDADGNPVSTRIMVGSDGMRWPMAGAGVSALVAEAIAVLASITSNAEYAQMVVTQTLPGLGDITASAAR